jgi:hypothetical protein
MPLSLKPLARMATVNKTVDSPLLNRLGAQALRSVVARSVFEMMPAPAEAEVSAAVDELRREGVVIVADFLPPDLFEEVRGECRRLLAARRDEVRAVQVGPNLHEIAEVCRFRAGELAATQLFFDDPRLGALLRAAERRPQCRRYAVTTVERLTQGPLGAGRDPECEMHSDCFFNTHKAWLYLNDVGMETGPFAFVRRSHRLTLDQVRFIYRESCRENLGSRRITRAELERAGLEETVITCPQNTLVVANTLGYHRRLRGQPGRERYALHVQLRTNPFAWWRYRSGAGAPSSAENGAFNYEQAKSV